MKAMVKTVKLNAMKAVPRARKGGKLKIIQKKARDKLKKELKEKNQKAKNPPLMEEDQDAPRPEDQMCFAADPGLVVRTQRTIKDEEREYKKEVRALMVELLGKKTVSEMHYRQKRRLLKGIMGLIAEGETVPEAVKKLLKGYLEHKGYLAGGVGGPRVRLPAEDFK